MEDADGGAVCVAEEGSRAVAAKPIAPRGRRPAAKRPARRKTVRWSKRAQGVFLKALGEGANVTAACRASGLADSTVYRRRRSDPAFLAEWQEALREGVARLEAELLDRALNGVEKAVWHGGKRVGSVRHYNDALALALLRAHGPTAGREAVAPPATREEQSAEMVEWLSELNRRMGGAG